MSVYSGTLGEQEYAHGRDQGREAADYFRDNFAAGIWDRLALAQEDARNAQNARTRAYYLGWLRGYREVVR